MIVPRVLVGPRFEIVLALAAAVAARPRARLPGSFWRAVDRANMPPAAWLALVDAPGAGDHPGFRELEAAIAAPPAAEIALRVATGLLHDAQAARSLLAGTDPAMAIGALPAKRREWLAHVGLYPTRDERGLALMARRPGPWRAAILTALRQFWRHSFAAVWRDSRPGLVRAAESTGRAIAGLDLAEIAARLGLRVHVADGHLQALRGGFRMPLAGAEIVLMPSRLNDEGYWTALPAGDGRFVACFAFKVPAARPAADPAQMLRALGDATRYAIAGLIAREPMTAVDVARALGVSKPTVSHHVFALREAGLVEERAVGRSVQLALRRAAVAAISRLTIAQLFDNPARPPRARSRRTP